MPHHWKETIQQLTNICKGKGIPRDRDYVGQINANRGDEIEGLGGLTCKSGRQACPVGLERAKRLGVRNKE